MDHSLSKDSLAVLGAPTLVYVRAVDPFVILREIGDEADGVTAKPGDVWYAVHAADGARLAVLDDRDAAFQAARNHNLHPVAVH